MHLFPVVFSETLEHGPLLLAWLVDVFAANVMHCHILLTRFLLDYIVPIHLILKTVLDDIFNTQAWFVVDCVFKRPSARKIQDLIILPVRGNFTVMLFLFFYLFCAFIYVEVRNVACKLSWLAEGLIFVGGVLLLKQLRMNKVMTTLIIIYI